MYAKVLKKKHARKYQHLPLHSEPEGLEKPYKLREPIGAGSKGARTRQGRENSAELGTLYKGGPGHVLYTDSRGVVSEMDIRPLEERNQKLDKVKRKEAIQFKVSMIKHRSGVYYFNKMDNAIIRQLAEHLVDGVVPYDLMDLCPYQQEDWSIGWTFWACNILANSKQ